MSEQAQGILQQIVARLRRAGKRLTLSQLLGGISLFVAIGGSLWLLLVGLEAGFWLPVGFRTSVFVVAIVVTLAAAIPWVIIPLLRYVGVLKALDDEEVARMIGKSQPDVSDRVVNLLQLASGRHSGSSSAFVSAAVSTLGHSVDHADFDAVEDFARPRRLSRYALIPVVCILAFVVAAPGSFFSASQRLASPGVSFQRPAAFQLNVTPGDATVLRGDSFPISVTTTGSRAPGLVSVETRLDGERKIETSTVAADSSGVYLHAIENVRRSFEYRVDAGEVNSPWFEVRVVDRPIVERLQVALDYPRYSRLPRQTLDPDIGDVTALRGTLVSVGVRTGGAAIRYAYVVHSNGQVDTLAVDQEEAAGSFRVWRDGTYHVRLESVDGVSNDSPISYAVRSLRDSAPTISIVAPEATHELDDDQLVSVVARISDDFGFNRLRLFYRLAESRFGDVTDQMTEVPIAVADARLLAQEVVFNWNTAASGYLPVPGDVFEYFLTVWDNDAVSGFKSATSATQRIVVPSLADKLEQLNESEDQVERSLEELVDRADEVRDQFNELKEELRQNPTPDWEDERQLERLQQSQQEMEQSVEELTQQMREINDEMQEQGVVSEETMQLFEDFQRVMEEIQSDELQQALETLREAMENMDLQKMQEALNEFEFQENQFQERLQRSLDLLKELRVRQGLEEVAEMANELAERQEELREQTQAIDEQQQQDGASEEQTEEAREDVAAEQELSAEEMQALEERLEELAEQMEEVGRAPTEGMQQLSDEAAEQDLSSKMQENAEQVRQNQLQPAMQGQQQMQQQLQGMQQQLGQMQQGMQGSQMQMDTEGLRRSLSDVLQLSEKQEDLRKLVDAAGGDGPRLRELARSQVEISDGLRVATDSLTNLARRIPQMSSALQQRAAEGLRDMSNATSSMSDRVPAQASGHQRAAMMQLNELALMLSDLLGSMNNPSGSGGSSMEEMMQQMQQMAGDQQQLNNQIQQMLNDMAGQRLTQDMQERMRSMAGQQDEMRRQLKEMSRNPELRGKALGDLDKIAQQMEETVRELERRRASRRTVERQQEILTRLLEATRSMQERGKEDRRESRTGEDSPRSSPDALPPNERLDALRRDLIRALEAGYSADYEELIKRYFEELQGAVDQ